jgi:hypothetical protein
MATSVRRRAAPGHNFFGGMCWGADNRRVRESFCRTGFSLSVFSRNSTNRKSGRLEACPTRRVSNLANIILGMQAREPAAHRVQLLFAKRFFDARKHFVFFQPHMIVKKFSQAAHLFRFNRSLRRKPLLEIPHGAANLSVIGEDSHDFCVLVKPRVPRVRGQQHFFLFAKMHVPRLVPEADKFLRLTHNRRRPFFRWRFGRAPHLQRLNQREVMVLAKWVQTRMAFHCSAVFFVKPME